MVNVTETSKDFAQERMYKCLDCEEQLHEEFAVCDECGSKDIKEVVRYQCPECSMVFDDYGVINKCPNCGYVPKGKIAWVRKPQFGSVRHHAELAEIIRLLGQLDENELPGIIAECQCNLLRLGMLSGVSQDTEALDSLVAAIGDNRVARNNLLLEMADSEEFFYLCKSFDLTEEQALKIVSDNLPTGWIASGLRSL